MASRKKQAVTAATAARAARNNPYVQRVMQDEDLRENFRVAFDAARDAYERLTNGKPPHKALASDKKLQKDLKQAAVALRDAGEALRKPVKKRRKRAGGAFKAALVATVGAGLALALSEDLRSKVLDAIFGKEEEFEYSSTTSPPTPAPEPVG